MTDAIKMLMKVPNVTPHRLAQLTAFIVSEENKMPRWYAGSEGCVQLLGIENSQVSLRIIMAYPYAGGQHLRKKTPKKYLLNLLKALEIFPDVEDEHFYMRD